MKWRYGVAAGALSILSFGAALYAFSLMETAKVSALRETSVVFAALMGSCSSAKASAAAGSLAALALAAGLVLMQFGGAAMARSSARARHVHLYARYLDQPRQPDAGADAAADRAQDLRR